MSGNILVLYSEIMGYNMACFRALVQRGYKVHCVHWDHKKNTPFAPNEELGIYFYKRSEHDLKTLLVLAQELAPKLVLTSGWMDKAYMKVASVLKKGGVPTVAGLDNWWKGTIKQRIGAAMSFMYIKPYFTHLFVPGKYQYTFAKKLGYSDKHILKGLLTCDDESFSKDTPYNLTKKRQDYPQKLLYVGRYVPIKGILPFVRAFNEIRGQLTGWILELYGNGELKDALMALSNEQVLVHDFASPEHLKEIYASAGVFCLPSLHEPWGLVVHEAACSGLPLLVSNTVGASTSFLLEGQNGVSFDIQDAQSLKLAILKVCTQSPLELHAMAERSYELSKSISVSAWAETILSTLH